MGQVVRMRETKAIKQRANALPEPEPARTYAIPLESMTPYELAQEMRYMIELLQRHEVDGRIEKMYGIMFGMLWNEFDNMCNVFGYAENWGEPVEDGPSAG